MKESIPRQVDKKSGVPEENGVLGSQGVDRGLGFSRRRTNFFFFKPRADNYTTKQLSLNSVLRII